MRQIESFFWGIIAALGALFVELLIFIVFSVKQLPITDISFSQFFALPSFVVAAVVVEEIFKYLIIAKRIDAVSLEKSYIVNSLFVGMGFFAVEFGLIYWNGALPTSQKILELALIHMGTCGIMGSYIALKNPRKIGTFLQAIIVASFFHAAYNFLVQQRGFFRNLIILILLAILIVLNFTNFFTLSKKLARS
jgi:hypothetical protein